MTQIEIEKKKNYTIYKNNGNIGGKFARKIKIVQD